MIFRNVTNAQLDAALLAVNKYFGNNIVWKRPYATLTVRDSGGPGARCSSDITNKDGRKRRLSAACWHAHGYFFEELWAIAPEAVIRAGELVMRGPQDNWQDRNIGSQVHPCMFSEACECDE